MKLLKYIANEVFSSKMLYEILQLQNEDAQCRRKSENLCQLLSSKKKKKTRGIKEHFFFELTCPKVFDVSVNQSSASFLLLSQSRAIFLISYQNKPENPFQSYDGAKKA